MNKSITAIMLTCGRIATIGEAVHSFNIQKYPNRNLIIIDTHPQNIVWDSPLPENVQYLKFPSSLFEDLASKTRFAIGLVKTPYVCFFEDDDIYFDWFISDLMAVANSIPESEKPKKIGHGQIFFSQGGVDGPITDFLLHQNMSWCRMIYEHRDGHWQNAKENPFDVKYFTLPWEETTLTIDGGHIPGYCYRWGTAQLHMSGWYSDKSNHAELYRKCEGIHSATRIDDTVVKIGWRHDYEKLARDAAAGHTIKGGVRQ